MGEFRFGFVPRRNRDGDDTPRKSARGNDPRFQTRDFGQAYPTDQALTASTNEALDQPHRLPFPIDSQNGPLVFFHRFCDSLGIYDRSSENSFILEKDLDQEQSEYLAALLGLYSHQEFILLFLEQTSGPDRLWIVKTPRSPELVIEALRRLNFTPVIVRTPKDQIEIWFIDILERHANVLKVLTPDVNGSADLTLGGAEMLGNQDRTTAIKGWRK
jgi:hypothetical protein